MKPIDIVIIIALAIAVIGVIAYLIKKKMKGESGCGCGCSGCPHAGACGGKKPVEKKTEEQDSAPADGEDNV